MERVRTTDPIEAEKLAKKGIPVDLVDDIEEKKSKKRPDYADVDGDGDKKEPMAKAFRDKERLKESQPEYAEKEYFQPISREAFADLPVGRTVQYRGTASKIKSNNGYAIELEDGAKINYNMFNDFGRIPHKNQYKDDIYESHTGNPNDKYIVRPCKNKKEPWAVWEGETRVKGFATKAEAKKYADKKNKKQGLKEIAEACYRKGMDRNKIAEVLKKYQSRLNESSGEYLVSYQIGSWGVSKEKKVTANSPENAIDIVTKEIKDKGDTITKDNMGNPVISAKPISGKTSYMVKEQDFLGPDNKDYEGEMAKSQMLKMKKYAVALCNMIEDESQLEAWVQAKLTKASEYMSAVYHYLDYQASQNNEMMVGSKPETDMIFMADKKELK